MTRIARIAVGLALAMACLAGPALATGEIPFEKAKGWDIERSAPGAKAQHCLMSKSYKDPDDSNAENGVIFILDEGKAYVTLVYEKWQFDKDEKVNAKILLDKKVVVSKSTWTGDTQILSTVLPDTIVPNMLAAKKLVLKFDEGEADFDLAGFPQAYESLRRCDATPVNLQAAPAPQPSEAQIKAFYMGAMIESAIKECDVPTTGTQRTAFGEKMAALRKAVGPAEAPIQAEVDKRPQPRCPSPEDASKLGVSVKDFIDKSPEEFMASVEKRASEADPSKPKP